MGHVLGHISIPLDIARNIETELQSDHVHAHEQIARERARLIRARDDVRRRMDTAYMDKLDGKIAEEFWQRKQSEWQAEEASITTQIQGLKETNFEERLIDVHRILELAQNAHSLYLTRKPAEQAELLRNVLLNCSIDAVSLYPTYRSPFDLIAKRAENAEWSGREDSNLRPPGPEYGRRHTLSFIFNSLHSYQPLSFLPKHAHSGLMGDPEWVTYGADEKMGSA